MTAGDGHRRCRNHLLDHHRLHFAELCSHHSVSLGVLFVLLPDDIPNLVMTMQLLLSELEKSLGCNVGAHEN